MGIVPREAISLVLLRAQLVDFQALQSRNRPDQTRPDHFDPSYLFIFPSKRLSHIVCQYNIAVVFVVRKERLHDLSAKSLSPPAATAVLETHV